MLSTIRRTILIRDPSPDNTDDTQTSVPRPDFGNAFSSVTGLLSTNTSSVYTKANNDKNSAIATIVTQANSTPRQIPSTIETSQERDTRNKSKRINFSLKINKFSGACNDDAKSWLSQFAQYCSCYDLDNKTKTNVFSFHLQDHAKIWYNSLTEEIKNDWDKLQTSFTKRFTTDRHLIVCFAVSFFFHIFFGVITTFAYMSLAAIIFSFCNTIVSSNTNNTESISIRQTIRPIAKIKPV